MTLLQRTSFFLVTSLTLSRILAVPLIGVLLYLNTERDILWALIVIVLAGLTDWLDGFLARRLKIKSRLGRFLDPIADKLLVVGILIFLLAWRELNLWIEIAALLIIIREVVISGLREHLALSNVVVRVSWVAKVKTASHLIAITLLTAFPVHGVILQNIFLGSYLLPIYHHIVILAMLVAALLAVVSALDYIIGSFSYLVRYELDEEA